MRKNTILFLVCLFFQIGVIAAVRPIKTPIKQAKPVLQQAALKTVLDHYRLDSVKYKAAKFLLENMAIHDSRTCYWVDSTGKNIPFNEFDYPDFKIATEKFNQISSKTKIHPVTALKNDIQAISPEYIIQNIDDVFNHRNNWNQYLPDSIMYNYLLPYRSMDEQFCFWRAIFRSEFEKYIAKLYPQSSVKQCCLLLSDSLKNWFFNTYFLKNRNVEPAYLSPKQMLFRRQGACEDIANWGVYLLRSIGIAATVDFTPAWATSTGSHYWDVAFSESGQEIPFFMGDDNPREFRMAREPSKVLRITYQNQPGALLNQYPTESVPDGLFRMKNIIDVTDQYWKTADLSFQLPDSMASSITYIAVLNGLKWKPIWWSKASGNNVSFHKTTCGVVYLPFVIRNKKMCFASYPQMLRVDNSIQILKPDRNHTRSIVLEEQSGYLKYRPGKKYSLFYWNNGWMKIDDQTAGEEKKLAFSSVPFNALFLLIPEYSEGKERPFTIDTTGNREWW